MRAIHHPILEAIAILKRVMSVSCRLCALTAVSLFAAAVVSATAPPQLPTEDIPGDTTAERKPGAVLPFPHGITKDSTVAANPFARDSLSSAADDSTVLAQLAAPAEQALPAEPDTLPPQPPPAVTRRVEYDNFTRFGYKDTGEALEIIPGLFPRQTSYYGQPFYLVPPGGSGRELLVLYRGRPYNDPVTGAADLSTFAVEEIGSADLSDGWNGAGPLNSGPVLTLHSPQRYLYRPRTHVIYRQGFYGLGHADWRIAEKVSPVFRYHFGVDIGENRGRWINSSSNTSKLRLGARQTLDRIGYLDFSWMQTNIRHGRPGSVGTISLRRNDFDFAFGRGEWNDPFSIEAAGWYIRSQRGYTYGDEDGYRLGARLFVRKRMETHEFRAQTDIERVGARFNRLPLLPDPAGARTVFGITLSDRFSSRLINAAVSVRGESAKINQAAGYDAKRFKADILGGGSASLDFGDSLGPGLLAEGSLGSHLPGMNEAFGQWFQYTPERLMDLSPVPDSSFSCTGDPFLKPVSGRFAAGGARWRFSPVREVRMIVGYRRYDNPIAPVETDPNVWIAQNRSNREGVEATGSGWAEVLGPFSLAGAFTWSDITGKDEPVPESWGWGALRFENEYFGDQLRMRVSLTARYWGGYSTEQRPVPETWEYDGLIAARVLSFEIYWGTNNILSQEYQFIPGFLSMHREEIWGVRWILRD